MTDSFAKDGATVSGLSGGAGVGQGAMLGRMRLRVLSLR
jgi:hypothetical protein